MKYSEKLKDPRWQKKRLEIFERDNWTCQWCEDTESTLNIHHLQYKENCDPWDYDNSDLLTLCEFCHEIEYGHRQENEEKLLENLKLSKLNNTDIRILSMCFYSWDIDFKLDENGDLLEEIYDPLKLSQLDKTFLFESIFLLVYEFIENKRKEKHGELKLFYTREHDNTGEMIQHIIKEMKNDESKIEFVRYDPS